MPRLQSPARDFRPEPFIRIGYDTFNGGLNDFFKDTEIRRNEMSLADNVYLIGKGIVTGRWGSQKYFLAGSGNTRLLDEYNNIQNSQKDLLAITDAGYLVKKSNASYTIITGASFASGAVSNGVQLGNNYYIASQNTNFVRYNGTNLIPYSGVSTPVIAGVSRLSGATGTVTWSYRLTALTASGETLPSTAVTLPNMPADLTNSTIRVAWNTVSAVSGLLKGYSLYRGLAGEETFIATVGSNATDFIDQGVPQSNTIFPPTSDTTRGVKAKYIKRFEDRIVIAGIENDPTMVMISGKYPYQDRFSWTYGGGYVRVSPDSGDEITGIEVAGVTSIGATTNSSILVFMKNRTFQMILNLVEIGNYLILNPTYQEIAPNGANSFNSIVNIRNNTFYVGREGIQTVGAEASYLNQIRTREISARVRGTLDNYSDTTLDSCSGGYMDNKYFASFNNKETIVYDYERASFVGKWKTPFTITRWLKYLENGTEKYLVGCDDGFIREFSPNYNSDDGVAIKKTVRFKREDGDRYDTMKTIIDYYLLFRNVTGDINVNFIIEDRSGLRSISKTINLTSTSGVNGWGNNPWLTTKWGESNNTVKTYLNDIIRYGYLYKSARTILLEIQTTGVLDNFEFVSLKLKAQYQPDGSLPPSYRL